MREYVITDLSPINGELGLLLEGAYTEEIRRRCRLIVDTEGPITKELLEKRVINSLGFQKIGSRIRIYLDSVMPTLDIDNECFHGEVIYHNGKEENFYRPQRDGDETARYSHQIPYREAMLAVEAIYQDDEDAAKGLLKRELSERFIHRLGFTKHGSNLDELFETVFQILKETDVLRKNSRGKFVFH